MFFGGTVLTGPGLLMPIHLVPSSVIDFRYWLGLRGEIPFSRPTTAEFARGREFHVPEFEADFHLTLLEASSSTYRTEMIILNLGCGTKTSGNSQVINYDWSPYLRLRNNPLLRCLAPLFLGPSRLERFRGLPENVVCHNLANGIPHPDNSVDVIFHSHLLEHLDRPVAASFQREVFRVLKPSGIQRIVVPDLELVCRTYIAHLELCRKHPAEIVHHDGRIAAIIEQCVRREGTGATEQSPLMRRIDNWLLGDARSRGETHQWMYDEVNLGAALQTAGFRSSVVRSFDTSGIPGWDEIGLDLNQDGSIYKPGSLFMEAVK